MGSGRKSTKVSIITGREFTWGKTAAVLLLIGFYVGLVTILNDPAKASDSGGSGQLTGRMTGGGLVLCEPVGGGGGAIVSAASDDDTDVIRITHGFELYCNSLNRPNNLEVQFRSNNIKGNFHLEEAQISICQDDPNIDPGQPPAQFDTITVTGTGRLNGRSGATIKITFTDAGEPGKDDTASFMITDPDGQVVVVPCTGKLQGGNHQAHDLQQNRK